ncbi:hypothetical protein ACWTV9_09515 [Clostridioides difficile]
MLKLYNLSTELKILELEKYGFYRINNESFTGMDKENKNVKEWFIKWSINGEEIVLARKCNVTQGIIYFSIKFLEKYSVEEILEKVVSSIEDSQIISIEDTSLVMTAENIVIKLH